MEIQRLKKRVIDYSFGVFGIIPLWIYRNTILRIAQLEEAL